MIKNICTSLIVMILIQTANAQKRPYQKDLNQYLTDNQQLDGKLRKKTVGSGWKVE
jgi:hypothetical protein